jgi:hypothetical protein
MGVLCTHVGWVFVVEVDVFAIPPYTTRQKRGLLCRPLILKLIHQRPANGVDRGGLVELFCYVCVILL